MMNFESIMSMHIYVLHFIFFLKVNILCSYNGVPEIDMAFDSEESAYQFYNAYARSVGFSIRRNNAWKSDGIVRRRKLCCSKEGKKGVDK
ncbi:hypothetical protein QJS10_CPA01g01218 [Acorus calamus]|uniref:FAR1 domain-containing protein n=1 Tax=Acorus calamus TaxID=4465 RepID=A0AAV9FTY6_ACOCL|nr:hypothetical protein QJS10_CPA01g01218 [Acorus calamus]